MTPPVPTRRRRPTYSGRDCLACGEPIYRTHRCRGGDLPEPMPADFRSQVQIATPPRTRTEQLTLTAKPVCVHPDGTEHDAPAVGTLDTVCDEYRHRGARLRWRVLGDPE